MAALADLERLFERLFERSSARLFRTHLQELQVERRVERAMERAREGQGSRTVVPARYRVRLDGADLQELAAPEGAEALAGRLADAALAFARAHGYHLPGRPTVSLVVDPSVDRGTVEVDAVASPARSTGGPSDNPPAGERQRSSQPVPDVPVLAPRAQPTPGAAVAGMTAGVGSGRLESALGPGAASADRAADAADVSAAPSRHGIQPVPGAVIAARVDLGVATGPVPGPALEAGSAPVAATASAQPVQPAPFDPGLDRRPGGIRSDGTETLVYRRPVPAPVSAVIRVIGRDGSERTIGVDGTPLTLGRAPDNVLVLPDARVSRHHARLQARRGTLVFTDLGSTNGSRLNGIRIDECALGAGDRVQVGDTVLLVEQLPG